MIARQLNDALQRYLADELRLSFKDLSQLPSMRRLYYSGDLSRERLTEGLKRMLLQHATKIPRKGARGGYDHIGSPDDRLRFIVEDIMTILDCGRPEKPTR